MVVKNVGDLKKLIKDLPDLMDIQVYNYTNGRYVSFQVVELEDCLDIEVYTKGEK